MVCGVINLSDKDYDIILPADVVTDLQQITAVSVFVAECDSTNDAAIVGVDVPSD